MASGIGGIVTGVGAIDVYMGFTGPTNFGSGDLILADSGSGGLTAIDGTDDQLSVPSGYVSGDPLSDSSTYPGQTFLSLGVTPGTYEWSWGTGPNQNITLIIRALNRRPRTRQRRAARDGARRAIAGRHDPPPRPEA